MELKRIATTMTYKESGNEIIKAPWSISHNKKNSQNLQEMMISSQLKHWQIRKKSTFMPKKNSTQFHKTKPLPCHKRNQQTSIGKTPLTWNKKIIQFHKNMFIMWLSLLEILGFATEIQLHVTHATADLCSCIRQVAHDIQLHATVRMQHVYTVLIYMFIYTY
jgi:hypothetical protein